MIQTYDVGSIPFNGDFERYLKGSQIESILGLLSSGERSSYRKYFEDKVLEGFIDKIEAGISFPNYPQFRDMTEMFLDRFKGIAKTANGYRVTDKISCVEKELEIPEVAVLKGRAREISEKVGDPITIKVCVTGPYTLASLFIQRRSQLFIQLGEIIAKFVEKNVFDHKYGTVPLVAVDEPIFGLVDDPLLDYGAGGREALLDAWETIFHRIKSSRAHSIIHLHSTTNDLFWQAQSLDIVESHVEDLLYSSRKTRPNLEKLDKFLKASVCITDFDSLIKRVESAHGAINDVTVNQRIADVWKRLKIGAVNPTTFLESTEVILNRLQRIVKHYGPRVSYAGPECGMKSFPTYSSAIECLRRVSEAVKRYELSEEFLFSS